jgi:hypothetical protein
MRKRWVERAEAEQSAFVIGRGLRDRTRDIGVRFKTVDLDVGVTMDRALAKLVKLRLEKES